MEILFFRALELTSAQASSKKFVNVDRFRLQMQLAGVGEWIA